MPVSDNLLLDLEPEIHSAIIGQDHYFYHDRRSAMTNTTVVGTMFFTWQTVLSDSAKQFISKIKSFQSLQPNWDSYGAIPPSANNIDLALSLIARADKNLLPIYFVAPGPNGELVIEFRKGNKEAAAYLHPDGSTELILQEGQNFVLEGTLESNYKDLLSFINS